MYEGVGGWFGCVVILYSVFYFIFLVSLLTGASFPSLGKRGLVEWINATQSIIQKWKCGANSGLGLWDSVSYLGMNG